jgi:glycosyltransferase involved in cell wall biosynthesis
MRILQVFPHLSKGGAERVVIELSNSLVEIENEVTILLAYPVEGSLNQNDLSEKITLQFISKKRKNRIQPYFQLLYWIVKNRRNLESYDVIHCHLTYGLIFGSIISMRRKFARNKGFKLIATCHVVGMETSYLRKNFNQKMSYFFDDFVLIAQDAYWRKFIEEKVRKNITVIVNGISPMISVNNSRSISIKRDQNIGTISRLHSERKPELFLKTFKHINDLGDSNYRFVIGGEGGERKNLQKLSSVLGIDERLAMPGLVEDPRLFLSTIDLYLTHVIEDVSGIAGLESVFAGIPVIGIQLSPDYQNGANDWIWSSPDVLEVAKKALEYLENPASLSNLAISQLAFARTKYSVERMRNNYLLLYRTKHEEDDSIDLH